MDQIWWKQISRASHFIRNTANAALDGKNIILSFPEFIPWQNTMYEIIEGILHTENPEYRLVFHECPAGDIGEFLLKEYCKREKRASYRFGMSYAAFLAKSEDIVLNTRYLWIKNVSGKKLEEWARFILDYNKNLPKHKSPAIFILETHSAGIRPPKIKGIRYISFDDNVDSYDKFTFCALASTDTDVKGYLRPYLADLVSTVCKDDIELCAACIQHWRDFLENPLQTLKRIAKQEVHSDGSSFCLDLKQETVEKSIWEGQIKLLFPIVEKYRSKFIKRHYAEINKALPVQTSYGDFIKNPLDVELGCIIQMVGNKYITLNDSEYTQLDNFRHARNDLAHSTPISFTRVDWILSQKI
ncbi:MAG: hypothetical protein Q4C91_15860 [Eubacteriales bacterium]|nr:hypothetical protein [Eubacteriales bacterium]